MRLITSVAIGCKRTIAPAMAPARGPHQRSASRPTSHAAAACSTMFTALNAAGWTPVTAALSQ